MGRGESVGAGRGGIRGARELRIRESGEQFVGLGKNLRRKKGPSFLLISTYHDMLICYDSQARPQFIQAYKYAPLTP